MKHLLIIIIILLNYPLSAQVKSGFLTYGESIVHAPVDTSKIKDRQVKEIIAQQNSAIEQALSSDSDLYELSFNRQEANFQVIPFVENDINPYLKRAVSPGIYYSNLKEDFKLHQLFAYDDYYLIRQNANVYVWNISKEKKKIGDYTCYKATTTIENGRTIKTEITAWFTPEIPFRFGPKNYGGLPGLILALEERGHYFYAKKIVLKQEEKKVKIPHKGKQVSQTEFTEIGRAVMKQMKGED
ncbi:GLPGLI family protein [Subsaximicrobium wynnwilliamsii]|uniref:GLPGLI family protein n=1 Tax=Subsaximicrobium wynnwilliamsii TaxID=291179 RepID=A0A5C6ZIA8_9FLAO|nr:GLPGLI family protein [Subsaximicrobium wynnwilliamsii]TXD83900.1 GLPGLI family protein [Subsaximicrobium wynnwilliamsii]TXD89640.1 GLPGLI family protein [Subsaximicrobium wynnwilliamsii]TXE02568.1 GLPGLI family protein [Subsaximicrobium wynnwilliamsii]